MQRGYNAVSYADLAQLLGMRTASIHYHFPGKADLGLAVLRRYTEAFFQALKEPTPDDPQSYVTAFESFLAPIRHMLTRDDTSCLCGVMSAEYASMSEDIQNELGAFFAKQSHWLATVLDGGTRAGVLTCPGPAKETARLMIAALQGATLIKKSTHDARYLENALDGLEALIIPGKKT